ncbi:MAG: sulfatase-like hydrolase/transferase [Candidatus Sumerlaeia bacterium]|nr:sulfatase-like hydrolase/transferase [Candidatus Sumerlaeia bacterium]
MKQVAVGGAALLAGVSLPNGSVGMAAAMNRGAKQPAGPDGAHPNVILCMADDLGWGDVGYNGHGVLKTPCLDEMARNGLRFDRWYAAAPVCSPTRGSCLTGRHPYRYGIFSANVGAMPKEEITLAEALKMQGYVTGHFGKWHVGTLTRDVKDARRGGRGDKNYSPPWENGFDVCFSTECQVPTWDPMVNQVFVSRYWTGPGTWATDNLEGDDSRVIMDRAIPFIRQAVAEQKPFLAVIWFHAPHEPVRAGAEYRKHYAEQDEQHQHYYGCITAMDEQVGRLRKELRALGIAGNTLLWFSSDNGPEHKTGPGSAGPFRGRKRDLFEGGVRVPGLLEWPAKIKTPRATAIPACTSDYFPTILEILGFKLKGQPQPLDGISILPLIEGTMSERPHPIAFESGNQVALNDNRYKIISIDGGKTFALYDIVEDGAETKDLAAIQPELRDRMVNRLEQWRASCKDSLAGKDYPRSSVPD